MGEADPYTVLPEASKINEDIYMVSPKDFHEEKHPAENLCQTAMKSSSGWYFEIRKIKGHCDVTCSSCGSILKTPTSDARNLATRHRDFGIQQLTGDR